MVTVSTTLAIDERLQARQAEAGNRIGGGARPGDLPGFGEAGLVVRPEVSDVMARSGRANSSAPVVGSLDAHWTGAADFSSDLGASRTGFRCSEQLV